MRFSEWKKLIELERKEKDVFFAFHEQSPIPPEERVTFTGLEYYPPDFKYRFEIELKKSQRKEIIEINDTAKNLRMFIKWGEFRFPIDRKEYALQAYKSDPNEEGLFIPFRDATSGSETYGAGRYLDLNPERDRTADGKWILDFNRAYNPFCAYSDAYACPFVPPENWLKVAILAGEKKYIRGKSKHL